MFASRGPWFKGFATLTIPFLALAFFIALGALDRVDKEEAASDDLDGVYPFATVAAIEGSLHEEGALGIALAAGLVEADEFTTATAATDEARVDLVDEITYHEPDSPIGSALIAIDAAMASIEQTRADLVAGTFEGAASEPYRDLFGLTRAAPEAILAAGGTAAIEAVSGTTNLRAERAAVSTRAARDMTSTGPIDTRSVWLPGTFGARLRKVRIQVGPVSRASALAWLDYAEGMVDVLRQVDSPVLSDEALDGFADLLDRWVETAKHEGPFIWISDESPELAEYLIRALYEAGLEVEALHEQGKADLRPTEADEFHVAMVNQIITSLGQEGEGYAQFADMLRSEWGIAGRT